MAKKKSKKKLFIILGIIFLFVLLIGIIVVKSSGIKPLPVTVAKVIRKTITQTVSAVGKIQPETEVKVSPETSGEVIFFGVKEGDYVKTGQLLVRIKPDIIETQMEQYKEGAEAAKVDIDARKADVDKTKADLKRATELYAKSFLSKEEFDRADAAFKQAESGYQGSLHRYTQSLAALKQFEKSFLRTTIYSPMSGVVTKLSIEKGETALGTAQMQGTEMMRISDLNVMNAVVDVDENDIVHVKIGDTARVEVDAIPNKVLKGVVLEIGHSAITSQLGTQDQVINFSVKIRLIDAENQLRPGMSCSVEIETETKVNTLAVPQQAVTIRDSVFNTKSDLTQDEQELKTKADEEKDKQKQKRPESIVFIYDNQKAKIKKVKTGISDKGFIEILEGLKEGDDIISGSYFTVSKLLQDGSMVYIDTMSNKKKNWDKK